MAAADEHLSIVRVAIYVAYLRPMYSAMQHKESNLNTFFLYMNGITKTHPVIYRFTLSSKIKTTCFLFYHSSNFQ
jgi:hypothetical protein